MVNFSGEPPPPPSPHLSPHLWTGFPPIFPLFHLQWNWVGQYISQSYKLQCSVNRCKFEFNPKMKWVVLNWVLAERTGFMQIYISIISVHIQRSEANIKLPKFWILCENPKTLTIITIIVILITNQAYYLGSFWKVSSLASWWQWSCPPGQTIRRTWWSSW